MESNYPRPVTEMSAERRPKWKWQRRRLFAIGIALLCIPIWEIYTIVVDPEGYYHEFIGQVPGNAGVSLEMAFAAIGTVTILVLSGRLIWLACRLLPPK